MCWCCVTADPSRSRMMRSTCWSGRVALPGSSAHPASSGWRRSRRSKNKREGSKQSLWADNFDRSEAETETGLKAGVGGLLVLCIVLCVAVFVCSAPAAAQQPPTPPDTVTSLQALVVIADRAETPLAASVAAVSRLTAHQLARIPHHTLADALRTLPGFATVDFDGLGYDPQLMVRGFYGGGEAEYVVVMVDGRPVNTLQSGGIAWDALPLGGAGVVEIVRGGASALYGDAALAGVINISTRGPRAHDARVGVAGGAFGTWRAQVDVQPDVLGRRVHVFGGAEHTDGFRDHAERTTWHAAGNVPLLTSTRATTTLSVSGHRRDFAEPGPLLADLLVEDRSAADVFFGFDQTRDDAVRGAIDGQVALGGSSRLSGGLHAEHRGIDAVRTIALTPEFADTKARVLRTDRVAGTVQLALDDTPVPWTDRLIAGIDASYGWLDSDYYNVVTGPRSAYQASSGARGELDSSGDGNRRALAAFTHYSTTPVEPVRLWAGLRADWLRDSFTADTPEEDSAETNHEAWSPKAGINVQYLR